MDTTHKRAPLRFQPTYHRDHEIVPVVFGNEIAFFQIREGGSGALMGQAPTRAAAIAMIDEVADNDHRPAQRLAAAHGRAAFFMGDQGPQGQISRFWRRAWGAAVVSRSMGGQRGDSEIAARLLLERTRRIDLAVDRSLFASARDIAGAVESVALAGSGVRR